MQRKPDIDSHFFSFPASNVFRNVIKLIYRIFFQIFSYILGQLVTASAAAAQTKKFNTIKFFQINRQKSDNDRKTSTRANLLDSVDMFIM